MPKFEKGHKPTPRKKDEFGANLPQQLVDETFRLLISQIKSRRTNTNKSGSECSISEISELMKSISKLLEVKKELGTKATDVSPMNVKDALGEDFDGPMDESVVQ